VPAVARALLGEYAPGQPPPDVARIDFGYATNEAGGTYFDTRLREGHKKLYR